ncbi:hypothetical protein E4U42_001445 [Claviceps africana]|uniref:Endonuclease/exonuclease/phosphatase domain-containing protein n=1 Tax=Claviceps africana TaxID=83212 RepID=A0A8K0IZW1_9HYPO|nr:hypothetical protein E4U42_001445 [Claviceps africana]
MHAYPVAPDDPLCSRRIRLAKPTRTTTAHGLAAQRHETRSSDSAAASSRVSSFASCCSARVAASLSAHRPDTQPSSAHVPRRPSPNPPSLPDDDDDDDDDTTHGLLPQCPVPRGRGLHETDGEFSPIFYRRDIWSCERSETKWLSATPDRPSRGWDAALDRIVTMGLFSHHATGARVVGGLARRRSAELLVRLAAAWGGRDAPSAVLLAGDLNSQPDEEPYKIMTAPGSGLADVSELLPDEFTSGNRLTYTGFGGQESPRRIDFLFVGQSLPVAVTNFRILANCFDDGTYLSDHRVVVSDLHVRIRA